MGIEDAVTLYDTKIANEQLSFESLSADKLRNTLRQYAAKSQSEFKVILLGDAEAGKTLTFHRLINDDKSLAIRSDLGNCLRQHLDRLSDQF